MSYPSNRQTVSPDAVAADQIKAFVRRIEALEDEIKALNGDKSEVYKEAKGNGFDVKVLRKVVAARRQDHSERLEQDALFDLYMEAVEGVAHAHVENIEEFDRLKIEPLPPHDADGVILDNSSTAARKDVRDNSTEAIGSTPAYDPVAATTPPAGTQAPPVETYSEPATLPTPSGIAEPGDRGAVPPPPAATVVPAVANADRSKPHPFCKDPEECGVEASWNHMCLSCHRAMEKALREGASA